MRKRSFLKRRRRGSALPLVLIAIVLLMVTGVGMLTAGYQARVYATRDADEIAAQVAADAGLEAAIAEINFKAGMTDCGDLTQPGTEVPSLSKPKDVALANSEATYSYKVVANSVKSLRDLTVTAVGKCGLAEKTVSARVGLSGGPFEYAIFADGHISLKPGSVVDGYNSDVDGDSMDIPVKMGTNSTEAGTVTLGPGAVVNGDVAVGPGADPDYVISADDDAIAGSTYALSEEKELPSVAVPTELESMPAQAVLTKSAVIAGVTKYAGINLGKGDSLTINGPTNLYVTGDIGLSNSAQIAINEKNPQAYLTLYLGGNLNMKNGGMINNTTQNPKRMQIYGLDSCTSMNLATGGIFYGAMYAPKAEVNIKSALEIYGSIAAAALNQGSTSNIHYDESLKSEGTEIASSGFSIVRWWEE